MINKRGSAETDLFWFLGILAILFITWIVTGGPQKNKSTHLFLPVASSSPVKLPVAIRDISVRTSPSSRASRATDLDDIQVKTEDSKKSSYYGQITLGWGNALGATNAISEYITISARSDNKSPITISGWRLENGGANRLFDQGGSVVRGQNIVAYLSYGVNLWRPNNATPLGPIILKPGDLAYVITGNPPSTNAPYNVQQNFRLNKCSGYLESIRYYNFYPSLNTNCPDSLREPGVEDVGDVCFKYIKSMPRCHIPFVDWDKTYGETVDGRHDLPPYCKAFVEKQYNYSTCVTEYSSDKDFYLPEWRIYLGRVWEMYYKEREMVTLYDSQGKIVDQLKTGDF